MVKILVVDDSALMRRRVTQMLERRGWQVVTARSGAHALQLVETQKPDAITLDINMPEMDGLTFLAHLMQVRPTPVVMLSSLTEKGALATFEALELGAVDYVHKPDGTVSLSLEVVEKQLCDKVAFAVGARVTARTPQRSSERAARSSRRSQGVSVRSDQSADPDRLVLIGASTGGPRALEDLLCALPDKVDAPILICQHMPAAFTGPFAQRLDQIARMRVTEVVGPVPVEPGTVYLGRGDADLILIRRKDRLMATSVPGDGRPWHPSVGRMVESAMSVFPPDRMIGVMLTGMGDDGAEEMAALYHHGGRTIAESEESCVVFGMPRALIGLRGAEAITPGHQIPTRLSHWLAAPSHRPRALAGRQVSS